MPTSRNDFDETRDLSALLRDADQLNGSQDAGTSTPTPAATPQSLPEVVADGDAAAPALQPAPTTAAGSQTAWADAPGAATGDAPLATQTLDSVPPPPSLPASGQSAQPDAPQPGKRRRLGVIAAGVALLAVLAGAGAYGGYYGAGHRALPGTTVGDVSVSGMTRAQIVKAVNQAAAEAKVSIAGDKVKQTTVAVADMGVHVNAQQAADQALKRNSSVGEYFRAPFSSHRIEPQLSSDAAKLAAFSHSLTEGVDGTFPATEPSVAPNADKTQFVAVPGKDGQGVPVAALLTSAKQAVAGAKTVTYQATLGPIKPQLDIETARSRAEEANALIKPAINLQVGDAKVSPNPAQRVAWVKVPDPGAKAQPSLNADAVKQWAHQVGDKLAVKKIDGERYKNDRGEVVLVKREAKDGVEVSNLDQLAQQIVTDIQAQRAFSGAVETKPVPAQWKEKVIAAGAEKLPYPAAPGEKWIDVNLTRHTTTAYEGATVVHGPLSMVPGGPRTPTVTGTYKIERKYRSKTMRGDNLDGSRYEIPGVPYAMYFHQGYALHGAPWRSNFSYEAMGPGSHGCINLPVSESRWFFDWAPMGTVVVSHY